jgi:hypothetical protein
MSEPGSAASPGLTQKNSEGLGRVRLRGSRQLGHPDPADLASLRAGLVSRRRGGRLSAHTARCPRCAQLCVELDLAGDVLAATSAPAFPESVEQRVLAALSLESVSRMRQPGPLPVAVGGRHRHGAGPARSPQGSPVPPSRRPSSRSGRRRLAPAVPRALGIPQILLPAVAGLLVLGAGAGYMLDTWSETPTAQEARTARTVSFLVTDSGTRYQKATLRAQVGDRLAARVTVPAVGPAQPGFPSWAATSPVPGAAIPRGVARTPSTAAPGHAGRVAPSPALVGCVLHLTGNVSPAFVDHATYQSRPVYVIAVPGRAWVVGVACTAANPMLITSVQLGARG